MQKGLLRAGCVITDWPLLAESDRLLAVGVAE